MTKVVNIISDINKAVFFEHTALRLRDAGIDISFILINSSKGELNKFLHEKGFRVHLLEVKKLISSLPQILACAKILRSEKPDAVHCHLGAANFVGLVAVLSLVSLHR